MEKLHTYPQIGEVLFRKRKGVKRISIRVHPVKGVSVTVPYMVPFVVAEAFLRLKREWVLATMTRQREKYCDITPTDPQEIAALRSQAKRDLPVRLAELAARYGFEYNRVTIKHNATNWGSCSARNNINLNLNIVRLPGILQDYILLHELCHLKHHDHGQAFHLLLEHVCKDNLLKLMEEKDELAMKLAQRTAHSKARYPLDHVMSKEIKQYRLL